MLTVRGLDRRPLALPAFRRLWLSSVVAAVGGSFSVVTVPAQLFELTGSSAAVGWSAAVSFPLLVLAALGSGSLADVVDRRRLLLLAHIGLAVTYALLWMHAVTGLRSVGLMLLLVGGQSLSYGVILTTTGAVLPRVVPADLLPAANSLSSLVRYGGAVIGPLLAGVLIPLVGLGTLYLLDAAALVAVLWAVFRLPSLPVAHRAAVTPTAARATTARDARAVVRGARAALGHLAGGWRRVGSDRILPAVLGLDLAAMAFGMPSALFPELATRDPGGPDGQAAVLGLLYAAYPAGVFASGLISGTFTRSHRPGTLMTAAALIWGLSVVLAGLTSSLPVTLAALGLGGAANFVLSTSRNVITQAYPDDAFRGRTQGALTIVLVGGPQAATLLHGLAGSALGPRLAICLGGLLTVTAVAMITAAAPQLWRYRQHT